MYKFNFATTAIVAAFSANTFAFDVPGAPDQPDAQSELMAVAIPTSVTSGVTWIKATPAASGSLTWSKTSYGFWRDLNPSFGFATGGSAAATTFKDGTVLRVGVSTQVIPAPNSLYTLAAPVTARSLATVELQKIFGDVTGAITWGQLRETISGLGMSGSSELVQGDSASTTFVTLTGSSPRLHMSTFSATATLSHNGPYDITQASLFGSSNVVRAADWSLGLSQKDVLRVGDYLGLTLAMPQKFISGSMPVSAAVSSGQLIDDSQHVAQSDSLQPTGTEKDFALVYATPMRFGGNMTAMARVKLQPGHDAQAPAQFGLGIRYLRTLK